jgi:hypothetical protein
MQLDVAARTELIVVTELEEQLTPSQEDLPFRLS